MELSRRDFMKLFGVSLASLLLTRCRGLGPPIVSCYAAPPPSTPTGLNFDALPARQRLRLCWYRFDELAQATSSGQNEDNRLDQQMAADHRRALDELVVTEELTAPVADLVQEAYAAAVYHVWRSNIDATCYAAVLVDYAPAGAGSLVQQAEALEAVAGTGTIDPATLASAQAALEHDMAFYALSNAEIEALYTQLVQDYQEKGQPIPPFDSLDLEITADARAAARFLIELLTEE